MLVSKKRYAILCGCNIRTIRNRINKKYIKVQKVKLPDGSKVEFINTVKFPPVMIRERGAGRKKKVKLRGKKPTDKKKG